MSTNTRTWLEIIELLGDTEETNEDVLFQCLKELEEYPESLYHDQTLAFLSSLRVAYPRLWLAHVLPLMQFWAREDKNRLLQLLDQFGTDKSEPPPDIAGPTPPQSDTDVYLSHLDLRANVEACEDVLFRTVETPVFYGNNGLCIVAHASEPDSSTKNRIVRPCDAPFVHYIDKVYLGYLLACKANWWTYDGRMKDYKQILQPPTKLMEVVIGNTESKQRRIVGLLSAPTLRPDGSILDHPGYDESTGYYYVPNGTQFDPIPQGQSRESARAAYNALAEIFRDFPLVQAGTSSIISMLMSILARPAVGNVPLFAVSGNTPGCGKGLLVDVVSMIALGRVATKMPEAETDEEQRKRLFSAMLTGDPILCIDNLTLPLGSASLDAALTSGSLTDRVLGTNTVKSAQLTSVICATGQNIRYRGDILRRVVPILLESPHEKPEEREDFAHAKLLDYVREQRVRLVSAALVILNAYCEAGRPKPDGLSQFGSFEAWNELIRYALVWAGADDPLTAKKLAEETSDPDVEALGLLLEAWHAVFPDEQGRTLRQVELEIKRYADENGNHVINDYSTLRDALGYFSRRYDGEKLEMSSIASAFKSRSQRIIGGKRLIRGEKNRFGVHWYVEKIEV